MARRPKEDPKAAFIPKTRVEAWRRQAYEAKAAADRVKLSEWMRRALDQAAGIEESPAPREAPQPVQPDLGDWANVDFD